MACCCSKASLSANLWVAMKSSKLPVGCAVVFVMLVSSLTYGQNERGGKPKYHPKPEPDCEALDFKTEVVSVEALEGGCVRYQYKVKTEGTCRYDLSHYTVAIPCGTVQDITNSRNWKQTIGKDPTTGLVGFKIDDVPYFGKSKGDYFTVSFVVCGEGCNEGPTEVAYKAGQCVVYETLTYPDDDSGDGDDDDDDGGGDDGGGDDGGGNDGGGDNGGGDNGGGGDDTSTCSTLLATLLSNQVSCKGLANGSMSVQVEDGTAPITYRWSNGSTESSIFNLTPGAYGVTFTDADGNVLTLSSEISEPEVITIIESVTQPSCSTSGNGSISLSVSGGTAPYTFAWTNGATTQNITNLNAGTFQVYVTDAAGCLSQRTFSLAATSQLLLSGVPTSTSCGQSTGSINLTVSGGQAPYSYSWNNGSTSEDIQNLPTGSYRVIVTDAGGCQSIGNYFVQETTDLRVTFQVVKSNCFNDPVGAIDLTVTGGAAPYSYSWQHGPTSQDVSGLISGIYRVTVTDNAGCSQLSTILVQRETLQVTAQVVQPTCSGEADGSVVLNPISGTGPYTYAWSNGTSEKSISNLGAGNYTVTVADASGCSVTLSYTLTSPTAIAITTHTSSSLCGQEGSFSAGVTVTGGSPPYQYLWSNGQTAANLLNLNSGEYEVTVTDSKGCTASEAITILSSDFEFECIIEAPVQPACQSFGNTISSTVQDADSYIWSVTSDDDSWKITSGQSTSSAIFTAGNSGTQATFTLTTTKGGCTKTCDYILTNGCEVKDNTGGGAPGTDDPCATQSEPPENPSEPVEDEPVPDKDDESSAPVICAYPNPFESELRFEWTAKHDDYAWLDIFDQHGRLVKRLYDGEVKKGHKYSAQWEDRNSGNCIMFYRYSSSHETMRGKLMKRGR